MWKFLKLARQLDASGQYEKADEIDQIVRFSSVENEGGFINDRRPEPVPNPELLKQINTSPTGDPYFSPFDETGPKLQRYTGDFVNNMTPEQLQAFLHDIDNPETEEEEEDYETKDAQMMQEMRQIASQYYEGQGDPLYAFSSSGYLKSIDQRNDALYNLAKDQQNYSNDSQEYREIYALYHYLESLIPVEFYINKEQRYDYLNYAYATVVPVDGMPGFEEFEIKVPDSKEYHLTGSIRGRMKDGEVISFSYGLYPDNGEGLMVKMNLSNEEVGRILEAITPI